MIGYELAKLDVVVWCCVKKGFQQFSEDNGVLNVTDDGARSTSGGSNSSLK
jgi:hypothetical protein